MIIIIIGILFVVNMSNKEDIQTQIIDVITKCENNDEGYLACLGELSNFGGNPCDALIGKKAIERCRHEMWGSCEEIDGYEKEECFALTEKDSSYCEKMTMRHTIEVTQSDIDEFEIDKALCFAATEKDPKYCDGLADNSTSKEICRRWANAPGMDPDDICIRNTPCYKYGLKKIKVEKKNPAYCNVVKDGVLKELCLESLS